MPIAKTFANASSASGPSLYDVADYIKTKDVKNIIVLVGAGVSTSAGIPDFRTPGTGLYSNLEQYSLPYPEAIFDLSYFYERPEAFFTLAKELYPGNFQPTLAHYFFVLLHQKKMLKRVHSQNIDALELMAGLPEEMLVQAHGSFATAKCLNCKKAWKVEELKDRIMTGEVLRCDEKSCKGNRRALIKSDIVFFGEALPALFFNRLSDFDHCDLLITIGTSLKVQPFASLVDRVDDDCPRLLINLESVGEMDEYEDDGSSGSLFGRYREEGFDFNGSTRGGKAMARDARWLGKADEGVKELAKALGWEQELLDLYERGHAQLKAENATSVTATPVSSTPPSPEFKAKKVAAEVAEADKAAAQDVDQIGEAKKAQDDGFDALAKDLEKLKVDRSSQVEETETGTVDKPETEKEEKKAAL